MNEPTESPPSFTAVQQIAGWSLVALFILAVWGSLFAAIWFLPSPWCYSGAFVAAGIYWLLQRDSVVETLAIIVLLLALIALLRTPIVRLRDYMTDQGNAAANIHSQNQEHVGEH